MPSPVVTITVNPAIDQTLVIPNFTAGAVNRVQSARSDAGGKGINVASFLADFGQPALVTGFLGRENDAIFNRLFAEKGIADRCIRIDGQTRTGLKVTDPVLDQTTDINFPGLAPSEADLGRLFKILSELAHEHEWFVLSGSLPPGALPDTYAAITKLLRGRKVVVDASGAALQHAVLAGPSLIKPNLDELADLTGERANSPAHVARLARGLAQTDLILAVVVSMGREGAVFVRGEEAVLAVPPPVEVKSTVGAGDAMVAGTVVAMIRGLPLDETARLATAFSVCAIGRPGHSLPSAEEVERAARQVEIVSV